MQQLDYDILRNRQRAYRRLFLSVDEKRKLNVFQRFLLRFLPPGIANNKIVDLNPDARIVVDDLLKFCNAADTTLDKEPLIMAFQEGKREVLLRIMAQLNIDIPEYLELAQTGEVQ